MIDWSSYIVPGKLVNQVRALFAFVFLFSLALFVVTFIDVLDMHDERQTQRVESVNKEVSRWLASYNDDLSYAHLALKPKKSLLAEHIVNDNYRAIQILIDEVQELHKIDNIYLYIESEVLLDNLTEIRGDLKNKTLSLLDEIGSQPHLRSFNNHEMYVLSGDLGQDGLTVALNIPVYFDAGDLAANLTLIKIIRTTDATQGKRQWIDADAHLYFTHLQESHLKTSDNFLSTLFINDHTVSEIPVMTGTEGAPLGYFYVTQSNSDIRDGILTTLFFSLSPLLFLALGIYVIFRFVQQKMISPVSEMSKVAHNHVNGSTDDRIRFMDKKDQDKWTELDSLGASFNKLLDVLDTKQRSLSSLNMSLESEVEQRTKELTKANRALKTLARTDALTGLGNRHAFDEAWGALTAGYLSGRVEKAVVAIVDCDFFKAINDEYGHHVGDQVLTTVSRKIRKYVPNNASLTRIGGDEFAILFDNYEIDGVLNRMKSISNEIKAVEPSKVGVKEHLSVSIGISTTSENKDINVFDLIKQADTAMYIAKQRFSQKVVKYDPKQHASTEEGLSHEKTVVVLNAIDKGTSLVLLFQPVYSLDTDTVDYFEVLSRIEVEGSLMTPGVFLPVVQRTKKEVEFDQAVVMVVLKKLQAGLISPGVGVSINLSAESLATEDVYEWFRPMEPYLAEHKIIIEITETTLIKKLDEVSSHISVFRSAGFKIALDDFGSGYSSISYLANLPVDIIKLDRSLAQVVCENESSAKLIVSLVEELSEIGYQIVIEGVEEQTMFDVLGSTSASHLQGFYINRPAQEPSSNVTHVCRTY